MFDTPVAVCVRGNRFTSPFYLWASFCLTDRRRGRGGGGWRSSKTGVGKVD